MFYLDRIQKAIDFIENNLTEKISVEDAAREGCLSIYHFHRVFQVMVGDSVMGYIRKRRLSAAAQKLAGTDESIIDIAFLFRFESQEAFTRAFKKRYGITPGICRKNRKKLDIFEKKIFPEGNISFYTGGLFMEPKIVFKKSFMVIGPRLRTTNENGQNFIQVPKFWEKCLKQKYWEKIPSLVNRNICFGICTDMDSNGNLSYIIANEVSSLDMIPKGMAGITVPASRYAVFTAKGKIPDKIQEITRYIYGEWLVKSGYERSDSMDIELYEESRLKLAEPEIDIYIPVK